MLEFSTLYFTFIMMYVSFSVFLSLCFSFILQAHTFLEATGAWIHSILMRVVYQLELSSFLCQLLTATTVFLLVLSLLMGKRKFIWTTDQKSKRVAPAVCTHTTNATQHRNPIRNTLAWLSLCARDFCQLPHSCTKSPGCPAIRSSSSSSSRSCLATNAATLFCPPSWRLCCAYFDAILMAQLLRKLRGNGQQTSLILYALPSLLRQSIFITQQQQHRKRQQLL